VKKHVERDDAVEHLLRSSLTGGTPRSSSSAGQCLDAEAVAAWVEGRLPASLASAAEAHAADCARCQALLAAFARTAPSAPAQKPVFDRWHLRWLVPVTAAAAAVVIYVVVPRPSALEEAERMARQQYSEPGPAVAPQAPIAAEPLAESARDSLAKRDRSARANEADGSVDRFRQDRAAGRGSAEGALERREAQTPVQQKLDQPPASQPGARSDDQARERSATLADTPAASAAAPPAPAAAGAGAGAANADARLKQEPAAPAPLEGRLGAARETVAARAVGAPVPPEIISRGNLSLRWRIGRPGVVLRTSDGGLTWEELVTGVNVPLRAGSEARGAVWMVGDAGTVLLSVDGRSRWTRVDAPANVTLVAVQATDERTATVTAADGRVFSTTDGGQTWR
jgi:hypothetical protein